jgi:hypothetical protein
MGWQSTDSVRAAYNRAEYLAERRLMMSHWADWLKTLETGTTWSQCGTLIRHNERNSRRLHSSRQSDMREPIPERGDPFDNGVRLGR